MTRIGTTRLATPVKAAALCSLLALIVFAIVHHRSASNPTPAIEPSTHAEPRIPGTAPAPSLSWSGDGLDQLIARETARALESGPLVRVTAALPRPVIDLIVGAGGTMADPGQPYQETDVVLEDLPWRRLIWAAKVHDLYVVHYEAGGDGHSEHVMIARLAPGAGNATVLWHAVGDRLADGAALVAAIDRHTILDDPRYLP